MQRCSACLKEAHRASSLARASLPPSRVALKKQRLAQDRRHRRRLERFGDQECRLRTLTSQEAFRIGGDENDRHFEGPQHFVDRIEPGAAVGKLNIGENNPGPLCFSKRHGFGVGARNAQHTVAETLHQSFEIERDERFVLNDQNVGGDLGCKFATGFLDKFAQLRCIDIQDLGGVVFRQPLKGDQEKGLTRLRRDLRQMALDRLVGLPPDGLPFSATEFQIFVKSR